MAGADHGKTGEEDIPGKVTVAAKTQAGNWRTTTIRVFTYHL